jgi:hypothetical protein
VPLLVDLIPAAESGPTLRPSTNRTDLAIALLILCLGTWIGVRAVQAFRSAGGAQYFYQSDFGAAVMLACGREFLDPDTRNAPALAAFLLQQSDSLACKDLPSVIPVTAMNAFQRSSRYLELAVALTWKLTGVSWSRLAILPGLLFGAVATLTYGLLRLAMSRGVALMALLPSVTSTPNFMQVPQLRDYAKGPFLLAVILIMGLVVVGRTDQRRVLAWSLLAGAVVGVGLGFRTDLVIALVPFAITLAVLVPPAVPIQARIAAIAVFLTTFVVVAFPVLRGLSQGGNNGHVILLGLLAEFDGPLRIEPSLYEFGGRYVDSLAFSTIDSYAIRVEGRSIDGTSREYERAASAYLAEVAATFPADVVTRVVAAIRTISKYFLDSSLYPPVQVRSESLRAAYRLRARVLWRLGMVGAVSLAAATLVVSASNPRAACLVVLVMIGFAGASAIQFNERHFFYLQFVPWWAFGLLAQTAIDGRRLLRTVTSRHIARALIFLAVVSGIAGGAVGLSRVYQQRTAARLFERYEAAPRSPLSVVRSPAAEGRVLIGAPDWLQSRPAGLPPIETRFLAVRFRDDLCGPVSLPVTIRYDGTRRDADLSESIRVRLGSDARSSTTLFVVAYDWPDYIRFRGVEVAADRAPCVAELSRVEGLERTPLLLTTWLGMDWRSERLYQRLR